MAKDSLRSLTIKEKIEKLTLKIPQEKIEKVFYEILKDSSLKSKC